MDPISIGVAIAGIVMGAAGAAAAPFLTDWLAKRKPKHPTMQITHTLCVIVLGLSRSGKTTFIRQITADQAADPSVRTTSVRIHSTTESLHDRLGEACTLCVVDYDGMNLGSLTSELENPRFSLVTATALVVIADAVDSPPDTGYSETRVEEHLAAWSENSLSGILGMFPHIRYTCLYLNKVDLLDGNQDLQLVFAPLLARIRDRVQGPLELRCGSLTEGRFVPAIKSAIFRTKVRKQ